MCEGGLVAEGGGVEPPALLRRRRPGFRDQLPSTQRHLPFDLAEGARIELAQPCLGAGLGLANRRFTAHPTFRTRRMIGIDCGRGGRNRTDKDPASKAGMLPVASRPDGRCAVAVRWQCSWM